MVQLHICSKSCQNGRRLHPYRSKTDDLSSLFHIKTCRYSLWSPVLQSSLFLLDVRRRPPPPRHQMYPVQLQPSVLLFTLCTCAEWRNLWEGSTLRAFAPKTKSKMKYDAAHAGAKPTNAPVHITSPEVQKSWSNGFHTRLEHYWPKPNRQIPTFPFVAGC